jgi:hypothetical protein
METNRMRTISAVARSGGMISNPFSTAGIDRVFLPQNLGSIWEAFSRCPMTNCGSLVKFSQVVLLLFRPIIRRFVLRLMIARRTLLLIKWSWVRVPAGSPSNEFIAHENLDRCVSTLGFRRSIGSKEAPKTASSSVLVSPFVS